MRTYSCLHSLCRKIPNFPCLLPSHDQSQPKVKKKRDGQRVKQEEGGAGRFRWCVWSSHNGEAEAGWPGDNHICQQSGFLTAFPVQSLLLPCSPSNYRPQESHCQCVICWWNTACLSPSVFPSPVSTVSLPLVCPRQLLSELNLFYLLSGGGRLFKFCLPYSRGVTRWDVLGRWYFIRQQC